MLTGKQEWVEGVRGWFDDGWRVSDRQAEVLEITIEGPVAYSRRVVTETYIGPDGETSPPATAALALGVPRLGWLPLASLGVLGAILVLGCAEKPTAPASMPR